MGASGDRITCYRNSIILVMDSIHHRLIDPLRPLGVSR